MYFSILMEEMNKWFERAMDESISEMIETLTERLYDNCTSDIQKAELVSIFTDAMEDLE